MSQTPENNQQLPLEEYSDDEINLIDIIYPIYKRRKFLIIFCLTITILVGIVSIFSEKVYEANAVILPETGDESGDIGVKAAFLEQFGMAGFGSSASTPSAVFGVVLKCNELTSDVLKYYDYNFIMGFMNDDKKEKIVKFITDEVRVSESKNDPSISISMNSNDSIFVADILNSYVSALDEYNHTNSFTSSRRQREYIENRLEVTEIELDESQKELREFQEKNRAISIGKQTEATLEVLAEMESQKIVLEVQKAAKEKFYKGPHIEIEQLKAQIEAIKKNINRLTYSEEQKVFIKDVEGNIEFYIPLTRIPALNYDESKLLLKVKAKTGVITMLTTQLEQAKLDEAKDMPTINTLSLATPPLKPVRPRKLFNAVLGFFMSMFLGILIIFFKEFIERLEHDPESASKWNEIKQGISRLIRFYKI